MPDVQRVGTPFSYSAVVVAGDTVCLALHRGFGDTFADQLRGTFDALTATLGGLGLTTASLVKVTARLRTITDLGLVTVGSEASAATRASPPTRRTGSSSSSRSPPMPGRAGSGWSTTATNYR